MSGFTLIFLNAQYAYPFSLLDLLLTWCSSFRWVQYLLELINPRLILSISWSEFKDGVSNGVYDVNVDIMYTVKYTNSKFWSWNGENPISIYRRSLLNKLDEMWKLSALAVDMKGVVGFFRWNDELSLSNLVGCLNRFVYMPDFNGKSHISLELQGHRHHTFFCVELKFSGYYTASDCMLLVYVCWKFYTDFVFGIRERSRIRWEILFFIFGKVIGKLAFISKFK